MSQGSTLLLTPAATTNSGSCTSRSDSRVRDTAPMDSDATPAGVVSRTDDRDRYELDVDGQVVAFAEFADHGRLITIPYIETDPQHRGKGYSSMLMDGVIDDLRTRGVQVRATCSVARAHISKHAAELLVS